MGNISNNLDAAVRPISVIMSVYINDQVEHFRNAIESLLCQTLLPSEIVIVVDGPVNFEIEEALQLFSSNSLFTIHRLATNMGLANALNAAGRVAKHGILARMDSDDICYPNRLEKQWSLMEEAQLDIVGSQISEFYVNKNNVVSVRKVPQTHEQIVKFIKWRSPFSHPSVMYTREVFEKLNGYDQDIFPEDYDFFVRAFLCGFKLGNTEEALLWFRLGEDGNDVIKRRRGFTYAVKEWYLYRKFRRLGLYSWCEYIIIVLVKLPIRLLPLFIVKIIYSKILRDS